MSGSPVGQSATYGDEERIDIIQIMRTIPKPVNISSKNFIRGRGCTNRQNERINLESGLVTGSGGSIGGDTTGSGSCGSGSDAINCLGHAPMASKS